MMIGRFCIAPHGNMTRRRTGKSAEPKGCHRVDAHFLTVRHHAATRSILDLGWLRRPVGIENADLRAVSLKKVYKPYAAR
jgi:hypothetical protein